MLAIIFGTPNNQYCILAKQLAEKLSVERTDFSFKYIDVAAEGISKADLENTIGRSFSGLPQIMIDEQHIGGFNDFDSYVKEL